MMRCYYIILVFMFALPAQAQLDDTSLAYTRAYPLANRGYALIREGRHAEALVLFKRVVELLPENLEYRKQLELLQAPIAIPSVVPQEIALPIPELVLPPAVATAKQLPLPPTPTTQTQDYKRRERFYDLSASAYKHRNAGNNTQAIKDFTAALEAQDNVKVREDYALTLKNEGMREESAAQLIQVLPAIDDADKRYAYQRDIQQLQDNWTSYGSVTFRDGLARISGIPGLQNFNDSLQYGFETIYSPDRFQRNGRRLLQFYGQAFASSNDGQFNFNADSTQGVIGVRTAPLQGVEWYLYGARLFRIGSEAIHDWQLRTTYSYTQGFDIDPNRDNWFYFFATPDISYLARREEVFASFEGRVGQSYRLHNWVLTPHFVGAAAHNRNNIDSRDSLEYGPGLSVKYWFDATNTRAHTGSADLIFQWREAVGPSEDQSGPFVRLVLQY